MSQLAIACLFITTVGACASTTTHPTTLPATHATMGTAPIVRGNPGPVVAYETTSNSPGRGALEGAGIGALVGGGLGIVSGLMAGDDPHCVEIDDNGTWDCLFAVEMTAGDKAVLRGVALGGLGALTGALIGAAVGHKTTERYVVGPTPRVAVTPAVGGARATATWAF